VKLTVEWFSEAADAEQRRGEFCRATGHLDSSRLGPLQARSLEVADAAATRELGYAPIVR
jgi:hypothetical protein